MKYDIQDKLLENVMNDDNKKAENFEKVVLLTTELIETYKQIEMMKNYIDEKNEELIISKKKEIVDINVARHMSPN